MSHEAILYDDDALAVPIRIVRSFHKMNDFSDDEEVPYAFIDCVQTIFSVNGKNTPLTPGTKIEYEMPDMYGRPWAKIWEQYFEQGMKQARSERGLVQLRQEVSPDGETDPLPGRTHDTGGARSATSLPFLVT